MHKGSHITDSKRIGCYYFFILFLAFITYSMAGCSETDNHVTDAKDKTWCADVNINNSISELYFPVLHNKYGENCSISSFSVSDDGFRMLISNMNGEIVASLKEDSFFYTSDYFKTNPITPILDIHTNETVGYCVLRHLVGDVNSKNSALLNEVACSSLDNSPRIKRALSNEQIVLLGDSKFGQPWDNPLPDMVMGLSGCQVWLCGFGGCRLAWLNQEGGNAYDTFSFSSICKSLARGDYQEQEQSPVASNFQYMICNLSHIDLSRKTTIIVNYSTNDITSSIEIDNIDNPLDRTTLLGAMEYGVSVIRERYPDTRFVFLSPDYRTIGDIGIDDYINLKGLTIFDYYEAIKRKCIALDVEFVDSYELPFRNRHVISNYTTDGTHFNGIGFVQYASFLNDVWSKRH